VNKVAEIICQVRRPLFCFDFYLHCVCTSCFVSAQRARFKSLMNYLTAVCRAVSGFTWPYQFNTKEKR
jgi:hypothetical protein